MTTWPSSGVHSFSFITSTIQFERLGSVWRKKNEEREGEREGGWRL